MAILRPHLDQLRGVAERLHLSLADRDLASFGELLEGTWQNYDHLDALPDELPAVRYPRTPGYRPEGEENPHNAWYIKTRVAGAADGPLAGKTIALKDNICLAGVPMMNGASTLEGYVPEIDATVVTRILDAGGEIVGKAHCEYFCLSGGSHTNATGPVHNPLRRGYAAGGSSSGSAALVAAGCVDMALGGDQGGSIRIPASLCGLCGMKPTHGLVPYTGIMPIENTLDHVGPITARVADNALLLEILAGPDGLDPRQEGAPSRPYREALGRGIEGMRCGVVREGFGHDISEPGVDAAVRAAAQRLEKLGASLEPVSIPMHRLGMAIWSGIAIEGLNEQMMKGNGFGFGWRGLYLPSLLGAHAHWRQRADELSDTLKLCMLAGEWIHQQYGGRLYAKAQNLSRRLRAAYDAELERCDLLLMPTLPCVAPPLPAPGAPREEIIARGFEMVPNTAPFDATGHPALSVPCGAVGGLPVGLMLVGKHCDEIALYRAAHALEQAGAWRDWDFVDTTAAG